MARYQYVGPSPVIFPALTGEVAAVLGTGIWQPGDVVELSDALSAQIEAGPHPHLVLTRHKVTPARAAPLEHPDSSAVLAGHKAAAVQAVGEAIAAAEASTAVDAASPTEPDPDPAVMDEE